MLLTTPDALSLLFNDSLAIQRSLEIPLSCRLSGGKNPECFTHQTPVVPNLIEASVCVFFWSYGVIVLSMFSVDVFFSAGAMTRDISHTASDRPAIRCSTKLLTNRLSLPTM